MLPKYVLLALIVYFAKYTECVGHYSIVGSKQIRPNSNYHVSVSLHDETNPCDIRISIQNDGDYSKSKEVTMQPYTTSIVEFETGTMLPGSQYKLVAEGLTGIVFKNETNINLNGKSFSTYIQTDKAIYKPGDTIRFRVLVLDANTKPAPIMGDMKVFIQDGNSNRVKQYANVTTTKGVYSDELQLSDFPVLGDWSINVDVNGETKKKTIEVAEYVLPKFEVTIDGKAHQTYKDGKIRGSVKSKYTYGKPVKGEATVSIERTDNRGWQPMKTDVLIQKTIDIDGKGIFEFDMKTDLKLDENEYQSEYKIQAVVVEALTGRKQSATFTVTLHLNAYTITKVSDAYSYKPGLPFEVLVKVAYHDGTPVIDNVNKLLISYGPNWDEKNYTSEQYSLDSNGLATVTLTLPDDISGVSMNAQYLELKQGVGYFSKATSKSGIFLQADVLTDVPKINEGVTVQISATEEMSYFTYQILGRGDVLVADTVLVEPKSKTHTFKFIASFSMMPKAELIIYYLKDGEIVSEKKELQFDAQLPNNIKIEMVETAKPGEDIDITISTRPNSYVGLLGVDQSVVILKSGNDLSKSEVMDQLAEYNQDYYSPSWGGRFWGGGYNEGPIWDDFNNGGAVLLTNAIEPERMYYPISAFAGGAIPLSIAAAGFGVAELAGGVGNLNQALSPKVRSEFPETWVWESIIDNSFSGTQTLQKKVPDTVTSWLVTGFSIDPITGLGLTQRPSKLEVFQPFFVSLDLPYSIKRGEVVAIPIVIFNYLPEDLDSVEVTLHNEDQSFEFTELTNDIEETPKIELFRRKRIAVPSNAGKATSFMIKPNKVGPLIIKVTATSPRAGDAMERILPVEPEGVAQFINDAMFVDLRTATEQEANFSIEIPKNAVEDSTRIHVTCIGDILGVSIQNLEGLIKMPYGCGEQNMLNFVPNIVVIEYLKATDQLTEAVASKAKKYMESGYQRELTYKHTDGSFSAFGMSDTSGSTWLTAFVARSFRQAVEHIDVDVQIIDDSLSWLSNVQAENGSFPEVGQVSHKDMQGGAGDGIALTAYTLICFLENQQKTHDTKYANVINKAMDYIVKNLDKLDDIYAYGLASYALQLAEHTAKDFVFAKFDSQAKSEGDRKWWEKPVADTNNVWYSKPNSVNIELSAYGLLTLIAGGQFTAGLPVMKWLLSQRNAEGGFQSTQDTCVGLQALAKIAEKMSSKYNNIQIGVSHCSDGADKLKEITINTENSLVLQDFEIPSTVREIEVVAKGTGFALLQVSYSYNINVAGASPQFHLEPNVDKTSTVDYLRLTVCTSYIPDAKYNVSNMAVMEAEFPSGFTADLDTLDSIRASENVKRVETKNADTVVVIYFDNVGGKELCPTMDAYRTHKVANQKPAPVVIYDYYDTTRRARQFYSGVSGSLCDICEGDDCTKMCQPSAEKQSSQRTESTASGSGSVSIASFVLLAAFTYLMAM